MRDFIENCTQNYADDRWRIRVISQEELYRQGCWQATEEEEDEEPEAEQVEHPDMAQGQVLPPFRGGKWGVYLRAPDIFFELLDRYRDAFTPLRDIADIRRGITSGCDDFFFVEDITDEALQEEPTEGKFRSRYGISRRHTNRIRIVRAGDDSVHIVEAEYLEPEIHSLMEIDSVEIDPSSLRRKVLFVSEPRRKLRRTHVGRYIRWGERQAFHERPTCAARDPWYDLTSALRSPIIYPKIQQYRHIVVWNEARHLCASSLLEVFPKEGNLAGSLCALLNSTLCVLTKHVFGRQHGREGSLQLDVYAANMMLVPDIRRADGHLLAGFSRSLEELRRRKALPLPDELELQDRYRLDDLTLQLIGMNNREERSGFIRRLYGELRQMYRAIRETELQMQVFRRHMARRGKLTPRSIAHDIWDAFDKSDLRHFPRDFVPVETSVEYLDLAPAKKVRLIDDLFQKGALRANGHTYALRHPDRAQFTARILEQGHSGKVAIPTEPGICARAVSEHDKYRTDTEEAFRERVAEYTADEEWQDKIAAELWKLHRANRD